MKLPTKNDIAVKTKTLPASVHNRMTDGLCSGNLFGGAYAASAMRTTE